MDKAARRLLSLSPYVTWSPNTGGTIRTHFLNRGYARAGWQVTQVSGASVMQCVRSVLPWADMTIAPGYREGVYFNPFIFLGNRLLRQFGTAQVSATLLPQLLRPGFRIAEEVERHRVILFEHPHMFDIAGPHLRDDHLVVLDAHNIESHIFAEQLHTKGLRGACARALRAVEGRCMRRADLVFACSPIDGAVAVREFGVDPARVHLATNGVDVAATALITDAERAQAKRQLGLEGSVALFVGSRWPANTEAARNIVAMAPVRPEITYLIVGAVGNALPSSLPTNVKVAGFVDDLHPWLAAADLAVNPMSSGSGSNVKVFEYCAAGLPTVSTPFGARGIEDPTGLAIVTCELAEFPDNIVALAGAGDLPERRVAARGLAEAKYDWCKIAASMAHKIEAALEAKRS